MKLKLPSVRFNRKVGTYAGGCFEASGELLSQEEFARRLPDLLPSNGDRDYIKSLMARPVLEAGAFANWVAPPARGIDGQPLDFQYVRYNEQ
jgi:benzoyl-CoA 2,3-dioxygenase component B